MDRQEITVQKSSEYDDDAEKMMTELFDLPNPGIVASISPSDKVANRKMQLSAQDKDLLSRGSLQESVPFHEERWQNKYQNDDEKKSSSRCSEHNSQKTQEQIADDSVKLNTSSSVETALSGITDANNTYQTKIQGRSLPAKKTSDNSIRNSVQETEEKDSYINSNINFTNDRDISAESSNTKVKLDSSTSENILLNKSAYNSIRKSENKNIHSKSETISPKNRCINKEHSSGNKLFETSAPIRLKKHYSKSSIDPLKNDTIFEKERKQEKKEQKGEIEINQESSLSKIKLLDSQVQERSNESKSNDNSCECNVNASRDTTVLNLKSCLEIETNRIANENENTSISNVQTSRIDSELLPERTHVSATKIFVKTDTQNGNIRTKLTDWQRDNLPVKTAVKKRIHSESSDESASTKKMQKEEEASLDGSLDENLMSDTEIFDRKVFSEDKRIYNNNENEKQIYWKRITEYMTKKRETYRYLRQKRKLKRKRQNKIKRIRKKFRDYFQDCLGPSKTESDEDRKIISECLEKRNLQFVSNNSEIYDTSYDVTTEEEVEDIYERDEILIHKHYVSVNNLQEDTQSVISKIESINSSDSTICIENDTLHDFTTDEETDENTDSNKDKISTCKRHMSDDTSQKDVECAIPMKIQRVEDSVLIADTETVVSKNDTGHNEDAVNVELKEVNMQNTQENQKNIENVNIEDAVYVEKKEVNMQNTQENQENVENNLTDEDIKISKDIRPTLKFSTISVQELISSIEKKDGCDVSQTVENVSLTRNEDIATNKTTVITDHTSLMSPKLEEDSSNKKGIVNEVPSSPTTYASSKRSDTNTSDDNSSTDDDIISDIEVEIKIKPKSKSRVSKKFSLKAPLSVVNTCICKNLNALKSKPDILGKLFQMSFKTSSENSRHENTINSEINETKNTSEKLSDVNQGITAETASHIREVICNSSHTTKDNANHSSKQQQERGSQNDTIFDRDQNATQHHQEETNKHVQSTEQEKMQMTNENGSESAKSASDLEKQLPKSSSNDKENKIADEQQKNPQDDIILIESGYATESDQREKNERVQSVEGKGTPPENSVESAKSARDVLDLTEQLPKTSSETLDSKRNTVRVRTSAELGSPWSPMNLSMNSDASIISDNTHSVPSASSACKSPPPHNSATKSTHYSPITNLLNISTDNISSNFDDIMKLVQAAIINVCYNFVSCRKIVQERIFTGEKMYRMRINLLQIYQNIDTLKILLHTTNEDRVINYINQQKMLAPPISVTEFKQYLLLFEHYISFITCAAPFRDNICSNMPQLSNINNSVPSASVPNVQAQSSYLGNVSGMPLPGVQRLRAQSSTMPSPRPNMNRSQSSTSTDNSSRLRQSVPNIRPCKVSSTSIPVPNPISNPTINPQQPVGNASYLQGQRMPNVSNVNNQQFFVNPDNAPCTTSSAASASNINTCIHPSTNQGNTNVSFTTGQKYSHIETRTTSSATAASAINMQQQNQTPYSQMSFYVNSGASYFSPSTTKQNINGMNQFMHNITQSKVCTTVNAPRNTTGNVGPGNPFVNLQMRTPPVPAEKSVPQYNNSVSNSVASQSASVHVQNILPNPSQQQQNLQQYLHQKLPIDTSVSLTNLLRNNVSQNTQPSIPNKKTGIPEIQIRDRMPNKTPFAKPQQNIHQGTSCKHNVCANTYECVHKVSQKSSSIFSKTPVSQEPNVSQNASNAASQKDKKRLILPKPTSVLSSPNEIVNSYFDLSFLTEIQKIILKNQLKDYFEKYSLKQQDSQTFRLERKMLIFFYESLNNCLTKMMIESQMNQNHIDEKLQNDVSRKVSKIPNHQSNIKSSCKETQSNKTNKNNSLCDKVRKKRSLKEKTDPNISVSSKFTMVESDLSMEAQNRESHLKSTSKSTIIEESSPGTVDLRKQNIDTPKMRCKKNLSFIMGEQSENIKTSLNSGHSNIPEENPIAETSYRISETKAQDNANIDKTARSLVENSHDERLSELYSLLTQDTSNFLRSALSGKRKDCSKIAKDDAKKTGNIETGNIFKISNVTTLNNIRENDAKSQSSFNTNTQDNIKNKETVKSPTKDLHDKRLSESCSSFAQKTLNLLQDDKTKDDNVNIEGPDNTETANICKISNTVTVLNSSGGNEKIASQVLCNTKTRDKELYYNEACNLNNKISGENSHDGKRDNVKENTKKSRSIFTESQFDTSCIPRTSTPFISDNTSELLFPINRSESAKKSQTYTAHKKYTFGRLSECFSNEQQDDSTNEQINNFERTNDESFESSGNLHIDENVEKSNSDLQEKQRDKISPFGNDKPNTSQDLCLDKTRCESIKITSFPPFVEDSELKLLVIEEQNVQKLNEELSFKQKEMQPQETSPSEIPKDTSCTRAAMESIDIVKELEDMKENQVDTHSGIKAINELLKHVSEHRYNGKSRTSSCNSTMKSNATNVNVNEAVVDKNGTSNAKFVASPTKSEDDHEDSDMSILNVTSISSSLFEKIDNFDALFSDDLVLLDEMKEKSSYVNDNPEIPNSASLNEIKIEESLDVNDNPEIPDFAPLNEIKIDEFLHVNDNLEVSDSASLNEIKIEEFLDVDDNLEIPDSALLNEIKKEKSSDVNDNSDIYNFGWLNEMKEEKSLNMNNDLEILNSASLNEIKEGNSSDMNDNVEVHDFVWLNEMKEEKFLNMNNDLEVLNPSSLNEIKEGMLSDVNDNLQVPDEIENRPCLRCKRKSIVYCQACLEAPYCCKRCSDLHWKAIHYKQCKNLYKPIICIDL
ncbi:uro-adherence factor A-like isoform X2 [Polyergus mexicanus]|uniref:uro-adherence factor A-like isoform X2 n=1 Tax=Polyergus mexicanus TaxID=615972 RepID=UPI0038B4D7DC